jgi:NADPH:quinone reductase-like Zn-dependent oxidoreductase
MATNADHSIFDDRRGLSQDGIHVAAGGGVWLGCDAPSAVTGAITVIDWAQEDGFLYGEHKPEGSSFLKDLLEAGKVAPIIDRRYPLSDVTEALR